MRKGKLRQLAARRAWCLFEKKFRLAIQALCTEEGSAGSVSS